MRGAGRRPSVPHGIRTGGVRPLVGATSGLGVDVRLAPAVAGARSLQGALVDVERAGAWRCASPARKPGRASVIRLSLRILAPGRPAWDAVARPTQPARLGRGRVRRRCSQGARGCS